MRRRPHVLALALATAAVLLVSAPALSATPPLTPAQTVPPTAGIQHSPAIAVDPAAPLRAVVTADDGGAAPPYPSTVTGMTANWAGPWSAGGALQYAGTGAASGGQADVAWGADTTTPATQNVFVVETGTSSGHNLCSGNAGILFSQSDDGGASFGTASPVDVGSSTTELVEPAIATAGTTVFIVYTELTWANAGCNGSPDSSSIRMISSSNGGASWSPQGSRRVSPLATTGLYRAPSVAPLPDGRVVVAFRNDTNAVPQIETETCSPFAPPSGTYCGAGPGLVGPSTAVGDATAPALASGVAGAPRPSVIAAGGRVVVAWHAASDVNVHAFAAMSTDNGVTFGPATRIDPGGTGNQVAPVLAATAGGRVDVAYLWDAGLGTVQATSVSANPPVPGSTAEAWAQPIVVQGVAAGAGASPIAGQLAPLGRRIGVATSAGPASPLPATVVAFTDTTSGQDVHVTGLLHGTTAPAIGAQTVRASKNATTVVKVTGSDGDGDPLTWSVGGQPSNPGSSVSVSDPSRGTFTFRAANAIGIETFDAVATDGVPGHETHATISVSVENDPPEITCSVLNAHEDEPLEIPLAPAPPGSTVPSCVKDVNQDQLTSTLDAAVGGTVEHTADGRWLFNPAPHSIATGSFMLHASDGVETTTRKVLVTVSPPVGKVTLKLAGGTRKRVIASGQAVRFAGQANDASGRKTPIYWTFGDRSREVQGDAVAHRFRRAGTFTVTARASTTSATVPVVARKRAVELVGVPGVTGGVMSVRVRTRLAGSLSLRADSRSQTVAVAAGSHVRTLRVQITTGPLVRLTLRLTPKKTRKSALLPVLSLRRLVLVSPRSAG